MLVVTALKLSVFITLLFVSATSAEDWGQGTPNKRPPEADIGNGKEIDVQIGYPLQCPAVEPCSGTTGPACIRSCRGRINGDYQSCRGCNMYATCSNGIMYDRRSCGSAPAWDDMEKRCVWKSTTCFHDTCALHLNVDIRNGNIDPGNAYFRWLVPLGGGPSPTCNNHGVLRIDKPSQMKGITFHMTIQGSLKQMATFHIAGHRKNDGFGDRFYGYEFGRNDYEMHANFGTIELYTSMLGGYRFYRAVMSPTVDNADIELCVTIRRGFIYISGSALRVTVAHKYYANWLKPMFISVNRPLANSMFKRFGSGHGLCNMKVVLSY